MFAALATYAGAMAGALVAVSPAALLYRARRDLRAARRARHRVSLSARLSGDEYVLGIDDAAAAGLWCTGLTGPRWPPHRHR